MFDLINGLPVHILVVHAAVVLIPLMALVTLAFTVRPRWRPGLPWAVLGNLAALGAAYVAKQSGEKLQTRLSTQAEHAVAVRHGELGEDLYLFALGLLVASIISWLLLRNERGSIAALTLAVTVVLVAGVAASVWTYRVGDSGSKEVWQGTIANTEAPAGG